MSTKFLTSALSHEKARPEFSVIHGNLAAGPCRIHRDNSLPAVDDEMTRRVSACGLIPSSPRNRATVSRVDLVHACKRALAFRDDWDRKNHHYPSLVVCMNGSLVYTAKNEGVGCTYGEIVDGLKVTDKVTPIKNGLKFHTHTMVFKHHNPDQVVSFGVNPRFLLDALEGMEGETVEIDIPAPHAPLYITDGTREASMMPVTMNTISL